MRDYALGSTFDLKFTTRAFATGIPTTMAANATVVAYADNSTTEITAGITLTYTGGFDGVAGLCNVRVAATSGNGYASGSNYALVISAGTVGGVSVVGEVVGEFSIEAQSPLRPTTAGLTLDVSATGEAGVDWANVGGKTTTNALTNTTIATTQQVDVNTIKTNPVVNGGTVTFPSNATLASTTNISAGTIATVSGNVVGSVGSVAGNVTGSVGSVVGNVGGNVSGSVGSVAGNVVGSVGSIATGGIAAASFAAGAVDAAALATDAVNEIADGVLNRDMSVGTDSGSDTFRTMRQALFFLRNKWTISGGTLTVYKVDDSSASWTSTVSTDPAAEPIVSNDPAGP